MLCCRDRDETGGLDLEDRRDMERSAVSPPASLAIIFWQLLSHLRSMIYVVLIFVMRVHLSRLQRKTFGLMTFFFKHSGM